jgi:hypothetical protein
MPDWARHRAIQGDIAIRDAAALQVRQRAIFKAREKQFR